MVVVGRAQAPPPWETPPTAKIPPPPQNYPLPAPPPPRVLTDSWGVGRIRTGCSRPPGVQQCVCRGKGYRGNVLCLNTLVSITTLGTLVVIHNDEGAQCQPNSTLSTLFNAPLEWWSTHIARARGGVWGSPPGLKVVIFSSKIVPSPAVCRGKGSGGECAVFEHPCEHHHIGLPCGDT